MREIDRARAGRCRCERRARDHPRVGHNTGERITKNRHEKKEKEKKRKKLCQRVEREREREGGCTADVKRKSCIDTQVKEETGKEGESDEGLETSPRG